MDNLSRFREQWLPWVLFKENIKMLIQKGILLCALSPCPVLLPFVLVSPLSRERIKWMQVRSDY